jgi:adenylate kinase family enzyme
MKTFKEFAQPASEKILYIMRGIPGSGKSTAARKLAPKGQIFSTDDYWGPEYNFDINRLGAAHTWNLERATEAMNNGVSPVVIDNTNVTWKAVRPYAEHGIRNGYKVVFKESEMPQWQEIANRLDAKDIRDEDVDFLTKNSVHNVPRESTQRMMMAWVSRKDMEQFLKLLEQQLETGTYGKWYGRSIKV